jgi:hypothetical protein
MLEPADTKITLGLQQVSGLKPGGLLICKMSLRWDPDGGSAGVGGNPLGRNELPLLVPELHVLSRTNDPYEVEALSNSFEESLEMRPETSYHGGEQSKGAG